MGPRIPGEVADRSRDFGAGLAVDGQGRPFVGATFERSENRFAAELHAFAPGPAPALVWSAALRDGLAEARALDSLALGPDGPLVALGRDQADEFWMVAVSPDTGARLWEFDDAQLGLAAVSLRDVAVTAEHVIAAGSWTLADDPLALTRAGVLVLDRDGALVCMISDEPGEAVSTGFADVTVDPTGAALLSGYVYAVDPIAGERVELLQARIDI